MSTRREAALAEELRHVELFRSVDIGVIEPLLRHCAVRVLAPGEVLLRAGEPNRHLFLVLEGRLSVRLDSPDSPPITYIERGETAGEMSLIDNQPASAWVCAEQDSRVMIIDEQLMWMLVNTSHAVSSNLLYTLVKRLREGNQVISHDREQIDDFRFHATVDALTGLFNRYWLDQMLPRQMQRSRADGEPLSLLMIDIDHFKGFNDRHGHLAGDAALRAVARALLDHLRPNDMAARFGGEEFAVLLPETDRQAARAVGERLRAAVAAAPVVLEDGTPLPSLSCSVGVGEMTPEARPRDLIAAADAALYAAKRAGRNRVSG